MATEKKVGKKEYKFGIDPQYNYVAYLDMPGQDNPVEFKATSIDKIAKLVGIAPNTARRIVHGKRVHRGLCNRVVIKRTKIEYKIPDADIKKLKIVQQ